MLELRAATLQHENGRLFGTVVNYGVRSKPIASPRHNGGRPFYEVVRRGAFDRALSGNVPMYVRHDPKQLIGNTRSGLLTLQSEERALSYSIELPDTTVARDARALVGSGVLSEMSFAFIAGREIWQADERHILQADLREISIVEEGAHSQTRAEARAVQRLGSAIRLRLRLAPWL